MNSFSILERGVRPFVSAVEKTLSKPQCKHLEEYLLGLMLPTDRRRKSIAAINGMVGRTDQSSLNRFINSPVGEQIANSWTKDLVNRIGKRRVILVIDDTLNKHPWAKKMEGVSSFFDHCEGKYVDAHQFVTSVLIIEKTQEEIPFLCRPYKKIDDFLNGCTCKLCLRLPNRMEQLGFVKCRCKNCNASEFKTKNQLAAEIIELARKNFNVVSVTFDSWYLCPTTLDCLKGIPVVSELKSNRWIHPYGSASPPEFPLVHSGTRYKKRMRLCGWEKLDGYAEKTLTGGKFTLRHSKCLKKFKLEYHCKLWISKEQCISILILYDPDKHEFKYLMCTDVNISKKRMLFLWRMRWKIEEVHRESKGLGLGEYQLRKLCSVLIHGQLTFIAYFLLKRLMAKGKEFFGETVNTIGECSRMIKRTLFRPKEKISWGC